MVRSCIKPENTAKTRPAIRFRFLTSPVSFSAGKDGRLEKIVTEANTLVDNQGTVKARGLGEYTDLQANNLIFAIGDAVDEHLGLPYAKYEFIGAAEPRHPIEGVNYEVDGSSVGLPAQGIFIAGWSRQSSYGLVGLARKDGINGAEAVLKYLEGVKVNAVFSIPLINRPDVVGKSDVFKLIECEQAKAAQLGLENYKYKTNEEMLSAIR